jgi:Tfp pilus assembly protein PilF
VQQFELVRRRIIVFPALGLALLAVVIASFVVARRANDRLPASDSALYEEASRTFYRGLASLEVGLLENARRDFDRVTALVPAEPAAWANLGLTRARLGDFETATEPLERAARLAADNSDVALLAGQVETSGGRPAAGLVQIRRAVELHPRHIRARFTFAQEIERSGVQNADALAAQQLDELLRQAPGNLVVLLERTRIAIRLRDANALRDLLARFETQRASWSPGVDEQYRALERAANAQDFAGAARSIAFLRNVLAPTPAFQESLSAVQSPAELIGVPVMRFLRLPSVNAMPAPPDVALAFSPQPFDERTARWTALIAFTPDAAGPVAVVATDGRQLRRIDGGEARPSFAAAPRAGTASGLLAIDWNHDFRMDVVTAGSDGIHLFLQAADETFTDATDAAARSDGPLAADCVNAWAADIEMDGDMDIVAGLRDATPLVLRNNGDGTWRKLQPFTGIANARAFAWGDLDRDGDPDVALLDERGDLHLFANRQAGSFARMSGPDGLTSVIALALGDVDADGVFDLVTLDAAGSVRRASRAADAWNGEQLAVWPGFPSAVSGSYRLFLSDVDNNGAPDVVASGAAGSFIRLAGTGSETPPLPGVGNAQIFGVADLDRDGDLDFVALVDRQPIRLIGQGRAGYHWQVIRPRAQPAAGDQRINSFGIGGEIEIRSGVRVQKQPITAAAVHFGLGRSPGIDVARIVWPNGVMQAEFDRRADQVIVAEQRLKGSCPWVFTYDGTGMRFVTDFLWRSPLGLRINAQDTADVTQTEDWIKVRGDQLVAREGVYDVRITADLWETHFIDHVSLMVVDHPGNVEMFVDERFSTGIPLLATHAMASLRAVPRAWDHRGRDVTALVAKQDGRYLGHFQRGAYQGVAEEHFVEVELDRDIARDRPLWLVAHGWIYPTDSSINAAIGQGNHPKPHGLSLEAQDDGGRWIVVSPDLGFPAGKNKTILIDLRKLADAGVPRARRLRLRTNLEIRWDSVAYAEGVDAAVLKTVRVQSSQADLRYRGFSQTHGSEGREAPEVPTYGAIVNVGQRWRDLIGYYTRFGDVRPLLAGIDDRYVIMNAGDELRLQFPAPPSPPAGWRRDFVLVGDGWVKDGDYNTDFSKTVQPLPSHQRLDDEEPAPGGELEHDPVYRRHAPDWQDYHTRFVTPRSFVSGLSRARP